MNDGAAPVVAISGASSFTALWIARALQANGWRVHALCHRRRDAYTGVRALRIGLLREWSEVHFDLRAEDGGLARWVRRHRPAVWIHHHHWMEAFRSPAYDVGQAKKVGLDPLPELVTALAHERAAGIVHSGTFFEPGEGGNPPATPSTPYARSKREVWEALAQQAGAAGLRASKVVIPNPIGPLENEDRLVPSLVRSSLQGMRFTLGAPDSVSDYLPVNVLAGVYVTTARELLAGRAQIRRPSGLLATARDWAHAVARDLIERRLGLEPCPLMEADEGRAASFRNPDSEREAIDWDSVWDDYARWITTLDLLDRWRRR